MNERKRYLVPPKLQTKFLLAAWTVWEIGFAVGMILLGLATQLYFLLVLTALELILTARSDKEHNAVWYLILVFLYYNGIQHYSGRLKHE